MQKSRFATAGRTHYRDKLTLVDRNGNAAQGRNIDLSDLIVFCQSSVRRITAIIIYRLFIAYLSLWLCDDAAVRVGFAGIHFGELLIEIDLLEAPCILKVERGVRILFSDRHGLG